MSAAWACESEMIEKKSYAYCLWFIPPDFNVNFALFLCLLDHMNGEAIK